MKIIKNCMEDPIEITCKECNSILSYTYEDIQRKTDNFLLTNFVKRYLVCPVCKNEIDLSPIAKINKEAQENE